LQRVDHPSRMPTSAREWRQIRKICRDKYHFDQFRPGQKEALEAVLHGRDTLAVLPTGSGKSAIYQLAGLMIPGPTVIVSPLIALQRDQAQGIAQAELAGAAVLNSLQPAAEREQTLADLEDQELEFLLLAPEQLASVETLSRIKQAKPSLFVVDEAHCISEWGHDFRPEYLRLGAAIEALGHPRTLALTATASAEVRREICERLNLRDPEIIVAGFDRPNIHLSVRGLTGERLKLEVLQQLLPELPRPGIVYAGTRRHAEDVAAALVASGVSAAAYHAGLKRDARHERQARFMEGGLEVIVATSAFGMGIDKPDVRFVVHYDVSDSLDSYYQEVGRAGRDGRPARAVLFYSDRDLNLQRFFAGSGKLEEAELERVVEFVSSQPKPVTTKHIAQALQLSSSKLGRALTRLEDHGAVQRLSSGKVRVLQRLADLATSISAAAVDQEQRRAQNRARVEAMSAYARLRTCRRQYLLDYFGEELDPPCSGCDNCDHPLASVA